MSANEKMPVINEQWHNYNSNLLKWSESLQPCEISDSELEKIKDVVHHLTSITVSILSINNPIEVTDIVEEDWNGHCIIFKHPKQVEEIEAVEFAECKKVFIVADIRKLLTEMNRGDISFSRMVELMNEKAFEVYKNEIFKNHK